MILQVDFRDAAAGVWSDSGFPKLCVLGGLRIMPMVPSTLVLLTSYFNGSIKVP